MKKYRNTLRDEAYDAGLQEGRVAGLQNLMNSGKFQLQEAMDLLGISAKDQDNFRKYFSS